MILIHNHSDLGWSWHEIVGSFLGLPIAYFAYGRIFTLFYLLFVLNVLVRKIRGSDMKELEEYRKKLREQQNGTAP